MRRILAGFAATCFCAYFLVLIYAERWAPRRVGFEVESRGRELVVVRVQGGTPGERAGVRVEDSLVALDGARPLGMREWHEFLMKRELGQEYAIEVIREGKPETLRLKLARETGDSFARLERKRYVQFFVLIFGIWVVMRYPSDPRMLVGGCLLMAIGTAPVFPDSEMRTVWRGLPLAVSAMLWVAQLAQFLMLPLFFTFYALLPGIPLRARWPWIAVWVPGIACSIWCASTLWREIHEPGGFPGTTPLTNFFGGLAVVLYGGGGMVAMLLNYRRQGSVERGRKRVAVYGSLLGWTPSLLFLTSIFWATLDLDSVLWWFVSTPYRLFALSMFLLAPAALMYGIFKGALHMTEEPGCSKLVRE